VAAAQANALADRGHEVSVITTDATAKGRRAFKPTFELLDARVKIQCIPGRTMRFWPGGVGPVIHPGSKRLLDAAVRQADVVHCHEWPHVLVQQARSLSRRYGKRCVIQPHGSIQPRKGMNRMIHALFALRYPPRPDDVFIVGTPAEEAELAAELGPGMTVYQVVNSMSIPEDDLDCSSTAALRAAWGFQDAATVLLYGHRIYPNKGLDLLIQAMESLPPTVHLAVVGAVGDPRFADECSNLVDQLGLQRRVRFHGPVGRDDLDRVIRAGDIFVLPARRDTFPLMVLHAMACARPVVVTSSCQSVELLRDAVAVAEPSPAGLAERIGSLLDPAAREALGRRARDLIRDDFGPSTVAQKLEHIYPLAP
jgi:glycosyltransferase involved in cell wall biosynthesis